jgi:hypothetical protein
VISPSQRPISVHIKLFDVETLLQTVKHFKTFKKRVCFFVGFGLVSAIRPKYKVIFPGHLKLAQAHIARVQCFQVQNTFCAHTLDALIPVPSE